MAKKIFGVGLDSMGGASAVFKGQKAVCLDGENWLYLLLDPDGDILFASSEPLTLDQARRADLDDQMADSEGCPGCGKIPGQGMTDGCNDPMGCGYWREVLVGAGSALAPESDTRHREAAAANIPPWLEVDA